eukprot:CAMPEP_0176364316 /NCGR_PEP_ID=MMETSP0126-20121128/19704_1 /TAXON_ID=141414 ORGANISM="Strombidinopsis acuminatum, Strain SPMC142" /NCGR_SAMPLE_ID=MMETSP0126 /ASSEMBLY_ACC=CAM_ASM_000229 /LENGTH=136 /DNA_ID=CAMNT_0017720907 /DNA_START=189 /DNA_END=599 /DNA_ORIENTATION=+
MAMDDRTRHVVNTKKNMNLGFLENKSAKRSVIRGQLKSEMPCLEFNKLERTVYNETIFQPHEMQWSIEAYLKNDIQFAMMKEANSRMSERLLSDIDKFIEFKNQGESTGMLKSDENEAKRSIMSNIEDLAKEEQEQ